MRPARRSDTYKLLQSLPRGYPLYYLALRTSRSGESKWVRIYASMLLKGEHFPSIEPIALPECRLLRHSSYMKHTSYRVTGFEDAGLYIVQTLGSIVHDAPGYFDARNLGEVSVLNDMLKFGVQNV